MLPYSEYASIASEDFAALNSGIAKINVNEVNIFYGILILVASCTLSLY